MSVHPDVPVKTLAELIAYAKVNPGKLIWGSQGFGLAPHLLAEMFKLEAGLNIVHVPYRGSAPVLAAILAGESRSSPTPAPRACRTSRPESSARWRCRWPALFETAGRADHRGGRLSEDARAVLAWRRGAAGTPPDIVNKLNAAFRDSLDPAGDARAARKPRRRDQDRHAGRVRQASRRRTRAMDRGGESREHQSRLKRAEQDFEKPP